jgi:hypothetical protein
MRLVGQTKGTSAESGFSHPTENCTSAEIPKVPEREQTYSVASAISEVSLNMNWYIASLLSSRKAKNGAEQTAQQCQYLIQAKDHDEAYERALELGNRSATRDQAFVGIMDLLLIHDQLADGAELLWSESELTTTEIENHILRKDDMRAFREGPSNNEWYICSIVLCEVHDEGSHGNLSLVWTNSYLIRASTAEKAYERAIQIGKGQQDEPGSHKCGGERAHWKFKGIKDITPVREVPAPDALLWCDGFSATFDELKGMLPDKPDLAVFKWEAEQLHQRS